MYSVYSPENKEAARRRSDMAVVRGDETPVSSGTTRLANLLS